MPRLEEVANVALRVPSIVVLDLLYRWDVQAFAELLRPQLEEASLRRRALWLAYYLGHVLCAVVLLLPLRALVRLYLYSLTLLLLFVGHQTARDYVRHELEAEFRGAVFQDPVALSRFITALTGQVLVSSLCALLVRSRQVWLFCAPLLPLLARLCGLPLPALPLVNTFATFLTVAEVLYVAASHLPAPGHLAAAACRAVAQGLQLDRLVGLAMALWSQLAIPVLFLVFWLVLFALRVSSLLASSSGLPAQQGLLFLFLSSVAECCGTPYSLLGLAFTVSYLALAVLSLCKFYLLGHAAFQNGHVMHRGVTEGVTLLLLALQTGLLDLQILQRTFLLSIILFIVVTSTLQSMIEIADPIVLALGASRNRSPWKHFRSLSLCLFLLLFPCFLAYKLVRFFHMDFWLLILVSSCLLTSLQVMGTLFVYALLVAELLWDAALARTDELVYGVGAVSRVLEFLVAVCVVAYGTWESVFGEWSWMGASVIIIHSYFNVWLRAQLGWRSFLLRRAAARKIRSLPRASRGQLREHHDVCAICYQDMDVAVITHCGHFFHTACLRKWLYVQDTCPMCHQPVKPGAAEGPQPDEHERAEGPQPDGRERAEGPQPDGRERAEPEPGPEGPQPDGGERAEPEPGPEGPQPDGGERAEGPQPDGRERAEGPQPDGRERAEPEPGPEGPQPDGGDRAEPEPGPEGPQPDGGDRAEPEPGAAERPPESGDAGAGGSPSAPAPGTGTALGGEEPSWQEPEDPALAGPSLRPDAVPRGEATHPDPAASRPPPPVSQGGCSPWPRASAGGRALLGAPPRQWRGAGPCQSPPRGSAPARRGRKQAA
ncbi:LOW QUALITY PROTEIN: RING finger protein 145-like [Pelodiscus sinensis]|uniref:LOW QUALITY PROTEIN: RING finger protein 145-like n=1 Tax=Pelodiscus sinensis TaxID=13735 RepID=UPI003F6B99AC